MIRNTVLLTEHFYYALGNVPAVSLTQDLPPEQDADILLLGCGDARNVLFTCFADAGRKLDFTCNDIEPGIHARNVLLYTLLIDDTENLNIEHIWNVYYHWKIDHKSVELLETQVKKLLGVSESIEQWNGSVYGSCIRFCDERSLKLVRSYWTGYRSRGLSGADKAQRQKQLQAAISRAKSNRVKGVNVSDLRAVAPVLSKEASSDLHKVAKQWWDRGTTPSSNSSGPRASELNPTLLYSPNANVLTLHYGISPIVGFPLSTAYVPIAKGSAFHVENKGPSSPERLIDCAKSHFAQWTLAFRKAIEKKSVIRILCSDALAACCTLRHIQLALPKRTASLNIFSDTWSSSPLKFHHSDYIDDEIAAPLNFDVIDTSNLIDHFGPLNVIGVASSLLKFNGSSSLYTEMLIQYDSNLNDRLSAAFGVDVRTMAMLLGLVLPDLFTNVTDSVEDDMIIGKLAEMGNTRAQFGGATQQRSRLRWRRSRGCPFINVETGALARLLIQIHDTMFDFESPEQIQRAYMLQGVSTISRQCNPAYNRASFAMLVNVLKSTVVSDWNRCVEFIYRQACSFDNIASLKLNSAQDLITQMHLYGVDNGKFPKDLMGDQRGAVLLPFLPRYSSGEVVEQVCVTIRVPREKLGIFTSKRPEEIGCPALVVSFEGGDPGGMEWLNFFSSVQTAYGQWYSETKQPDSYPYIEEDSSQLSGSSDLFASVFVPTYMLLFAKKSVPWVQCGLKITPQNRRNFSFLGPNYVFARSKMTDKNVFITRYMPGMSGLPVFAPDSERKDKPPSAPTTARLLENGSKIDTLIQRLTLECPKAKSMLANPLSAVDVKFKSPLIALVNIAQCQEQIEFPIPVSPSKYKFRISRKSSYIEIESPLFDPLDEDDGSFMFPTFMTEAPGGVTAPMPWTSSRINLDAMPSINLKDKRAISWLETHITQSFSERELLIRESPNVDVRTNLKNGLCSIFMFFSGLTGQKTDYFGLKKEEGATSSYQTLIFPSCLRLDLVNHSVVLDTAIIPLTHTMLENPKAVEFLQQLTNAGGLGKITVNKSALRAWKAMMPALVERCRTVATWKHTPSCEYTQTGKVPLTRGLNKDGVLPICSCSIGKFPSGDYLASQSKKLSKLKYMLKRYGTRAAISLIFTVPYVEGCYLREKLLNDFAGSCTSKEECKSCGKNKRESNPAGEQALLVCAGCHKAKYCSRKCQKADWKTHKPVCSAA